MDTIRIQGLRCRAKVGVSSWERKDGCLCEIDLEIGRDLELAAWSDRLENTLDYMQVSRDIVDIAEKTHCHLLETMAQKICNHLLTEPNVIQVRVLLKKKEIVGGPAMDFAAVDITRRNETH
jgi:7,8-dihydroneopterin aldolase/epimerase/oxygenase